MRIFVSFSHRRGFGNFEITLTPRRIMLEDIREIERVLKKEHGILDPVVLWWRVLEIEEPKEGDAHESAH